MRLAREDGSDCEDVSQAGSSVALRVEAAVPLIEVPGTIRPFGRIVVQLAYADGPVLNAVLAEVSPA